MSDFQCILKLFLVESFANISYRLTRMKINMYLTISHLITSQEGFEFKCQSINATRKGVFETRYTKDEIDYFATFFDGQCYLVPVEECGTAKTLRFCYPKNGQKKGISLAETYLLKEVIKQYK